MLGGGNLGLAVLVGAGLVLGYLAHLVFRAHRVSDVGLLMLAGLLLGPVLGVADPASLKPAMPFLSALALVIVLFEGGLELDWLEAKPHAGRAFALTLVTWTLTALGVAAACVLMLGMSFPLAALFGAATAATGMLVVIPLLGQIRATPEARTILTVETSVGDMLGALVVGTGSALLLSGASPLLGAASLVARLFVGAAVGILAGVAWARVMHRLNPGKHGYALTLGALLLTYAGAEGLGGSGFLAALAFGLFLGNARSLVRVGGLRGLAPMPESLRGTQSEILFALRSVYFLFLGLSIPRALLTPGFLALGVAFLVVIVLVRIVGVRLTQRDGPSRGVILAMMPRGLATAATAAIPAAMGVPGADGFGAYVFALILAADLATSVALWLVLRQQSAEVPASALA